MTAKRFLAATLAATSALAAAVPFAATAATYYWLPGASGGLWSDPGNWSTESAAGDPAEAVPTAADDLSGTVRIVTDLDGGEGAVNNWVDICGGTHEFSNGTIVFNGTVRAKNSPTINFKNGANVVFAPGSSFYLSFQSGSGKSTYNFESGSSLDFQGKIYIYNAAINIAENAVARFAWTRFGAGDGTNQKGSGLFNRGRVEIPNGMKWESGGWSANNFDFTLRNYPGATLVIGGEFSKYLADGSKNNTHVVSKIEIQGGTVVVTDDVSFDANALSISGETTWDVADGKTADLTGFSFEDGAEMTKTGDGALLLPAYPGLLTVNGGTVSGTSSAAAMPALDVGPGGKFRTPCENFTIASIGSFAGVLEIAHPGLAVTSVGSFTGSATVDLSLFSPGAAVVVSDNAALRAAVLAAARSAAAGTDLEFEDSGTSVKVAVPAGSYVFSGENGVTDMADANGWAGGELPSAGDIVSVGAGVTAVLTPGTPAFSAIAVSSGATLKYASLPDAGTSVTFDDGASLVLMDGVTLGISALPSASALVLESGSTLEIAADASLAIPAGYLFCSAADDAPLPTIVARAGSAVSVPDGFAFKNVDLVLDGATLASDGELRLGTAEAGETGRFCLAATNAVISTAGNKTLYVLSPANGGTVEASGDLLLKDTSILTGLGYVRFGLNNPVSSPATVRLDGTDLSFADTATSPDTGVSVGGAVTVSMENGSKLYRATPSNPQYGAMEVAISESGNMTFSGTDANSSVELRYPFCGNGSSSFKSNPSDDGFVSAKLVGTRAWVWKTTGNGKGVWSVSDATFKFGMVYWWGQRPRPFAGLKEVRIEDGTTLTLVRQKLGGNWSYGDAAVGSSNDAADGTETVQIADVPFSGGGSLVVTNTYDKTFHVCIVNGANTATGTAAAYDTDESRAGLTQLLFRNGANWAGKVIWNGNVRIVTATNAVDKAYYEDPDAPASVSFGGVQLDADLALRVWKDATTDEIESDRIDIGTIGWSGSGVVAFDFQDGYEPEGGESWLLGTMPAEGELPGVSPRSVMLVKEEIDGGDGSLVIVRAKIAKGTFIILR
ncbi:MAG: hypothetical protein IJ783_04535 [Kiritimatiellae bacterium]|nr:hypothetical protein [Kiritimatiellia bacterium]